MEKGWEDEEEGLNNFYDTIVSHQLSIERQYYRECVYLVNGIDKYLYDFIWGIIPKLFDYDRDIETMESINPSYLCSCYWKDYVEYIVTGNEEQYNRVHQIWFGDNED